jgi:ATP-dependent DNA ligase
MPRPASPPPKPAGLRSLADPRARVSKAICEHELEGVVAKRRTGRYVSGERGWIKTKNGDY